MSSIHDMTDISRGFGGVATSSDSFVTTDHATILGSGIASDPIRVNPAALSSGGDTIQAAFNIAIPVIPGLAVAVGPPEIEGFPSISGLGGPSLPAVVGLVTIVGGFVTVQNIGAVELTASEWDAATSPADNQSGGLLVGQRYYVSMDADDGKLTSKQPSGFGFVVDMGLAVSRTRLLLGSPFPFTQI